MLQVLLASGAAPVLDAERLHVYRAAVEFQALAAGLMVSAPASLRDQLDRASVSIVLNVAEGAGRRSRRDKRRFYSMARGSAMECAAILEILRVRAVTSDEECRQGRALVVRIVQMLTKLEQAMG